MSGTSTTDHDAPSQRSTRGRALSEELMPITPTAQPEVADGTETACRLLRPLPNCGTGSDPQAGSDAAVAASRGVDVDRDDAPLAPPATYPTKTATSAAARNTRERECVIMGSVIPPRRPQKSYDSVTSSRVPSPPASVRRCANSG